MRSPLASEDAFEKITLVTDRRAITYTKICFDDVKNLCWNQGQIFGSGNKIMMNVIKPGTNLSRLIANTGNPKLDKIIVLASVVYSRMLYIRLWKERC